MMKALITLVIIVLINYVQSTDLCKVNEKSTNDYYEMALKIYSDYINHPYYVFKNLDDDKIAILKKHKGTLILEEDMTKFKIKKENMSKFKIDKENAYYHGYSFIIEKIFYKFNPNETLNYTMATQGINIHKKADIKYLPTEFKVNNFLLEMKLDNFSESGLDATITFFKNLKRAYIPIISSKNLINYSGIIPIYDYYGNLMNYYYINNNIIYNEYDSDKNLIKSYLYFTEPKLINDTIKCVCDTELCVYVKEFKNDTEDNYYFSTLENFQKNNAYKIIHKNTKNNNTEISTYDSENNLEKRISIYFNKGTDFLIYTNKKLDNCSNIKNVYLKKEIDKDLYEAYLSYKKENDIYNIIILKNNKIFISGQYYNDTNADNLSIFENNELMGYLKYNINGELINNYDSKNMSDTILNLIEKKLFTNQ